MGEGGYVWTSDFRILKGVGAGGGWQAWLLQDPEPLLLAHPASQEVSYVQQLPLLKLVVNYLPSIFISAVNFVLPPVFKLIAPLERYTRSRQIVFILLRFQPSGVGWG